MTNDEIITNSSNSKHNYDLEERTAKFGENIIKFAEKIAITPVTRSLIDQLIQTHYVLLHYCHSDPERSEGEESFW